VMGWDNEVPGRWPIVDGRTLNANTRPPYSAYPQGQDTLFFFFFFFFLVACCLALGLFFPLSPKGLA
jgi:hypothetical protein